jgi:hypothetical protein
MDVLGRRPMSTVCGTVYARSAGDYEFPLLAVDAAAELDAWLRNRPRGFNACNCVKQVVMEELKSSKRPADVPNLSGLALVGLALEAPRTSTLPQLVSQASELLDDLPSDSSPSPSDLNAPEAKPAKALRDFFIALSETAAETREGLATSVPPHPWRRF